MDTQDTPRLLRPAQVCAMLGCGRTHLFNLVKSGALSPVRFGPKYTAFPEAEVLAWMAARLAEREQLNADASARRGPRGNQTARLAA